MTGTTATLAIARGCIASYLITRLHGGFVELLLLIALLCVQEVLRHKASVDA